MDKRRCVISGWLVAVALLFLFFYTTMHTEVQAPVVTQMSQLLGVLKNQTAKLKPSIEYKPFVPSYGPVADVRLIPEDDVLKDMKLIELEDIYMRYIENIQQACGNSHHMGGEWDGGYHVCEKYLTKDSCLVYSFGSRRMYGFEDDVEKAYGCEIHVFDPFDGQKDHQHSAKIRFHSLGLGGEDKDKLLTLTSVKKRLNQSNRTLDILKIDIEGGEWAALPNIVASGELERVKLFIAEFHVCLGGCKKFPYRTKDLYLSRLAALRKMYNMGFRMYYFRLWTMCKLVNERNEVVTGCHESHFMKVY